MLYRARNSVIKSYDDCYLTASEAKNRETRATKQDGKTLKILSPKQMLITNSSHTRKSWQ